MTGNDCGTGAMANGQENAVLLETGMAANVAGQPQPVARRQRTYFRVSGRGGLLLLILVIGCGMGWIAQVLRTGPIQRLAVAAIYQAGGWVVYDTDWEEGKNKANWKPGWPKWFTPDQRFAVRGENFTTGI